jgi:hypothetical protein
VLAHHHLSYCCCRVLLLCRALPGLRAGLACPPAACRSDLQTQVGPATRSPTRRRPRGMLAVSAAALLLLLLLLPGGAL